MLHGGCLCGRVRYQIEGALRHITHCHCSMCRKAHGAAFATYASLRRSRLTIVSGDQFIRRYRSSDHVVRESCAECGSPLFWSHDERPDVMEVTLGTLDDDPIGRPVAHIYWASRAPWLELADDGLPKHDALPKNDDEP